MIIREVKPSDFDDIVATYFTFFDEVEEDPSFGLLLARERQTMEQEHKWFDRVLKDIQEGNGIMMVSEVDSHVIGWCEVRRVSPKSPADHRGDLGVCVKKEFRAQGIGEALMKAILKKCKGRFEIIELAVFTHNHSARKLYEKLGFKTFGTRRHAVKRGGRYFDDYLMYLEL